MSDKQAFWVVTGALAAFRTALPQLIEVAERMASSVFELKETLELITGGQSLSMLEAENALIAWEAFKRGER